MIQYNMRAVEDSSVTKSELMGVVLNYLPDALYAKALNNVVVKDGVTFIDGFDMDEIIGSDLKCLDSLPTTEDYEGNAMWLTEQLCEVVESRLYAEGFNYAILDIDVNKEIDVASTFDGKAVGEITDYKDKDVIEGVLKGINKDSFINDYKIVYFKGTVR